MSENLAKNPLSILLPAAFMGCIIALMTLAWLPEEVMRRTTLGGYAEHFIAYLGTATIMGLAFRKSPRLVVLCALLIMYAAILEMGQLYSPGRHASFQDFASALLAQSLNWRGFHGWHAAAVALAENWLIYAAGSSKHHLGEMLSGYVRGRLQSCGI
jgi:hypothetical protein